MAGDREKGAKVERVEKAEKAVISRRRLLKLAAYSVPAASVLNVARATRVLAQTPHRPWGWMQLPPWVTPVSPEARAEGAMGGLMLFGGEGSLLGDLWEAHPCPMAWLPPVGSGSGPSPRSRHAMAELGWNCGWQWLGERYLLFGGYGETDFLGDTWLLEPDGSGLLSWRQVVGSPSPPARADHALVSLCWFDGTTWRSEALLFGGQNSDGFLGDTWIFDLSSETWIQLSPDPAPGPRAGHTLGGTQWTSEAIYLFWGEAADGLRGDTWRFDGGSRTWTPLELSGGPSPRRDHAVSAGWAPPELGWGEAMCLFGGRDASGVLGDTWLFEPSGSVWMELSLSPAPEARAGHVMSSRSACWCWGGPEVGPPTEGCCGPLLFGGENANGEKLGDTWILCLGPMPS